MYKIIHLKGSTYYLRCFANCGIYDLGDGEVVLIDSCDHKKSVNDLIAGLDEFGWRVKAIFHTHGHIDHIYGNEKLSEKYDCVVYAHGAEQGEAAYPSIDATYFYSGTMVKTAQPEINAFGEAGDDFLTDPGVKVGELTPEVLPDGFEMISLPGHSFDMVGIKTPDDVWFIGDSLVSEEIFETYHFPLFLFPNAAIRTCREILPELKGSLFVLTHLPPLESIEELAVKNAEELEKMKGYILSICDGRSFEGIFAKADEDFGLQITHDRYAKMTMMIKMLLSSLIEDGKIKSYYEGHRMIYRAC